MKEGGGGKREEGGGSGRTQTFFRVILEVLRISKKLVKVVTLDMVVVGGGKGGLNYSQDYSTLHMRV